MATSPELPERRLKNLFAAIIAAGVLIIGSILITRYSAKLGLSVIIIGLIGASLFYTLNNRHHKQQKVADKEPAEFDE